MKINTTLVNGEPRVKMNHPLKIFKMAHLYYPIIQTFSSWPLGGVTFSLLLNGIGQKENDYECPLLVSSTERKKLSFPQRNLLHSIIKDILERTE